jgi:hypothetical protein
MTVIYKIENEDGTVDTKVNTKITTFNDKFWDFCKKEYQKLGKKLLSVEWTTHKSTQNPKYELYNDLYNEGGEGFNPHERFITEEVKIVWQ